MAKERVRPQCAKSKTKLKADKSIREMFEAKPELTLIQMGQEYLRYMQRFNIKKGAKINE